MTEPREALRKALLQLEAERLREDPKVHGTICSTKARVNEMLERLVKGESLVHVLARCYVLGRMDERRRPDADSA